MTGQFEAGLAEAAAAGVESSENNGKHEQSSDSDILEDDDDNKQQKSTKLESQSPGKQSTSEPSSLRFKLKVSSTPVTNNSSKNLLQPKNDVSPVGVSNNSTASTPTDPTEPKVPKLKIRLGKDKNAVKLNNDVDHHDTNDLDDNFGINDKSHNNAGSSPLNDLKIKIKPLTGSPNSEDQNHSNITSPYFPNLSNNIVNHTNIEERKRKKLKSDRLAVWTESLAKHSQRDSETVKTETEKLKETKSWPEVLESRLYGGAERPGQSSNDHSGSINKFDNQDKGRNIVTKSNFLSAK